MDSATEKHNRKFEPGKDFVNLTGLNLKVEDKDGEVLSIDGNPRNMMLLCNKDEIRGDKLPEGNSYVAIVCDEVGRELAKPEYVHKYRGRFVGPSGLTQTRVQFGSCGGFQDYREVVTEWVMYKDFTPEFRVLSSFNELFTK